jgi:hypothetical protein
LIATDIPVSNALYPALGGKQMAEIKVRGADGKPVRYASLDGQNLKLQFEYYARHDNEGDYEVIQTVAPEEFAAIANKFGLDPTSDILAIVQQISDAGRGEEFVDALNSKEIKCEIFTWSS